MVAVNRRQLLGVSLAGIIAALSLPFERFAEWCREWVGTKRRTVLLSSIRAEIDALYEQFGEQLSQFAWGGVCHDFEWVRA